MYSQDSYNKESRLKTTDTGRNFVVEKIRVCLTNLNTATDQDYQKSTSLKLKFKKNK